MLLLGLEREFRGSCLPPGDASAFAITDAAWLAFFAKLAFSKDMFLESFTAIMYDIMLFSLISDREEVILDLVRLISFSFECFDVNFSTRCRAWRSTTYMRPLSRSTFQTLRCFRQLCRATGNHLQTFSS